LGLPYIVLKGDPYAEFEFPFVEFEFVLERSRAGVHVEFLIGGRNPESETVAIVEFEFPFVEFEFVLERYRVGVHVEFLIRGRG